MSCRPGQRATKHTEDAHLSRQRVSQTPLEHLIAEVAAWPLASERSFTLGLDQLDPSLQGSTGKLWRSLEDRLASVTAQSIDELNAIRDFVWFGAGQEIQHGIQQSSQHNTLPEHVARSRQALHSVLHRFSMCYLRGEGASVVPEMTRDSVPGQPEKSEVTPERSREEFRWLTFALPEDVLVCGLEQSQDLFARLEKVSPRLRNHLKQNGFAESHLHLGAAIRFPLLWVSTQVALADTQVDPETFASRGAVFSDGRFFADWLVRGLTVRYLLAAFLSTADSAAHSGDTSFEEWFRSSQNRLAGKLSPTLLVVMRRTVAEVLQGRLASSHEHTTTGRGGSSSGNVRQNFYWAQKIYRTLTGVTSHDFNRRFPERSEWSSFASWHRSGNQPNFSRAADTSESSAASRMLDVMMQVQHLDGISSFFPGDRTGLRTPEQEFMHAGLARLQQQPGDTTFARLFWQTIRLRNIYYRYIVQRPLTPGLQWFIRTYDRLSTGTNPLTLPVQITSAMRCCGFTQGLQSLEVRRAPRRDVSSTLKFLTTAQAAAHHISKPDDRQSGESAEFQFGIVFHFVRGRGGKADTGCAEAYSANSNADPTTAAVLGRTLPKRVVNPTGYRYASYYMQNRRLATTLVTTLHHFPLTLRLVRGIDVCTDELGIPNWVVAPLVRYVKDASRAASNRVAAEHGLKIRSLRTTVHVGEDFVHLAGGLRRIHEAIEQFGLSEGSRLGHAVALGIDPVRWGATCRRLFMSIEERLFDLVWEWQCVARKLFRIAARRILFIENRIREMTGEIFGRRVEASEMATVIGFLQDESMLSRVGFPDGLRFHGFDRRHSQRRSNGRNAAFRDAAFRDEAFRDEDQNSRFNQRGSFEDMMELLYLWLCSPSVFARSQQVIPIDIDDEEISSLVAQQQYLCRRVERNRIAIEINPSSNLLQISAICNSTLSGEWHHLLRGGHLNPRMQQSQIRTNCRRPTRREVLD